ncbi:hypothetical protein MSAN_00636400 [Mycena sanguinolenta]|uniref:Uncharacterized protein n=1 Tax=Mycena sanguinolenta TaxID=230812 RepID=A0A8H6Z323_9AGAR|nr:hypothetical protein MSAN_00636400 [Mycena sanguinolenta]
MLLVLVLVQLLSRARGTTLPVHSHLLDARASMDSCDDINQCRRLYDVVWSCLATIFACTWVSVHPNVPPVDQTALMAFWGRLKLMLIAIIAPEVMVGFAAVQCFSAREFGISRTHGFFLCMGGFVSSTGTPITSEKQLRDCVELQDAIRRVSLKDIQDKSKGDALSKGVALAQGLWFTIQCIARVQQHLAVTELEVITLAFAVVSIFLWILWWNKPLDVQRPISVVLVQPPPWPRSRIRTLGLRQLMNAFLQNFIAPLTTESARIVTLLAGIMFGAIHVAAWNTEFPTTAEKWIWRPSSLLITAIPAVILLPIAVRSLLVNKNQKVYKTHSSIAAIMTVGAFPIYVVARLLLLVIPFVALRDLPPSAFMAVSWSRYIPHT